MIYKTLIGIGIFIAGGIGAWYYVASQPDTYNKPEVEEVALPEWASDTEAVEAAQAVMRKKALTEEINGLEGKISALTATYDARLNELMEQKTNKEKELGSY